MDIFYNVSCHTKNLATSFSNTSCRNPRDGSVGVRELTATMTTHVKGRADQGRRGVAHRGDDQTFDSGRDFRSATNNRQQPDAVE